MANTFIKPSDSVTFKTSIYECTITGAELDDWHNETILMKDAILMLVNPDESSESWDLYFNNKKDAKEYLRDLFSKGNWNQDFINKVFK